MTIDNIAFTDNEFGKSINPEEIIDNFGFLDEWEERYAYIIDLGKQLPAFPEAEKTEENKVHGCQSQVWVIHYKDPDSGKIYWLIDSDALIVRGLAAIVLAAFNGQTAEGAKTLDMESLFEQLDLLRHISPTRGNGLRAMVKRIQQESAATCASER